MQTVRTPNPPDFVLFLTILILLGIGLVMVFSASYETARVAMGDPYHFLKSQAQWIFLGLILMLLLQGFDYHRLKKLTIPLLIAAFILLLLVYVNGIGVEVNGARRWVRFFGFSLQPSEMMKVVMVLFAAGYLSRTGTDLRNFWHSSFPVLMVMGTAMVLIMMEDLGTAVAMAGNIMIILFAAGIPWGQIACLGLLALPALGLAIYLEPYRMARFMSFLNPEMDPLGAGYQLRQSLLALGSGTILGAGLGNSRQKLFYLPEPQNDFIFAVIGEELGLIGTLTVTALFFCLIWRGIRIAMAAPDTYGSLLAVGLTMMIGLQAIINIAVVTGSIPVTGINLPFISAGGSSLFFALGGMGILLNISKHTIQ